MTLQDPTVQWLLESDPAIRWQTVRDLLEADVRIVEADESSIFCEITRTLHKENTV